MVIPNIFTTRTCPAWTTTTSRGPTTTRILFNAEEGADQPTAKPISMITGEDIKVESGPNWDDDLGGSQIYAANDPNSGQGLSEQQRLQLSSVERLVLFYLPRICNHCLNPCCVAACPSGALYKRGEDGIVLIDQKKCRAWRSCVAACPYKKTYFNWFTGKSEKCILCFPRLETGRGTCLLSFLCGQDSVSRCAAVRCRSAGRGCKLAGRRTRRGASVTDSRSARSLRSSARPNRQGFPDGVIESAQQSPVYKFVMDWKIALPPHIEYRTLPMLFYVPPMSPVIANFERRLGTITKCKICFTGSMRRASRCSTLPTCLAAGTKASCATRWASNWLCVGIAARRPLAMLIEPRPIVFCGRRIAPIEEADDDLSADVVMHVRGSICHPAHVSRAGY